MRRGTSPWSPAGIAALLFAMAAGALIGLPLKPRPESAPRRPHPLIGVRASPAPLAPVERAVWNLLSPPESGPAPVAARIAKNIAALGREGLPVTLGILLGALVEPEDGPKSIHPQALELREAILKEALRSFPSTAWISALEPLAGRSAPLETRLAAISLLGELGDANAAGPLLAIARTLDEAALASDKVAGELERALALLLARDERAFDELAGVVTGRASPLAPSVARVLARSGTARAVALLTRSFGRSPELDRVLLEGLAACGQRSLEGLPEELAESARDRLDDSDPALRAAAAAAAGALHDPFAAEGLIALLDDESPEVALAALESLQRLSRLELGPNRAAWEGWYEDESNWYELDSEDLTLALHSEDAAEAVSAIETIVRHPLYRHRAADDIAELVLGSDGEVAMAACAALEQIGTPRALRALESARKHSPDEDVRATCEQALLALQGSTRQAQ